VSDENPRTGYPVECLAVQLHRPFDSILAEAAKAGATDAQYAAAGVVKGPFENWRSVVDTFRTLLADPKVQARFDLSGS